jgi:hypothetical protein
MWFVGGGGIPLFASSIHTAKPPIQYIPGTRWPEQEAIHAPLASITVKNIQGMEHYVHLSILPERNLEGIFMLLSFLNFSSPFSMIMLGWEFVSNKWETNRESGRGGGMWTRVLWSLLWLQRGRSSLWLKKQLKRAQISSHKAGFPHCF